MNCQRVLQYLEDKIDMDHLDMVEKTIEDALSYKKVDFIPLSVTFPQTEFQALPYVEAFNDMESMFYNELVSCINTVCVKDYSLLVARSNYGVGTLPSLFGLKSRVVQSTNLPWVDHVELNEIKNIISKGVPDLDTGFGKRIIETYEYYREQLSHYEKCNESIKLYHPDLQGPFDVAHLMWGADIYMAMYDSPDLVHELLSLVTETYIEYMKKIKPYLNDERGNDYSYHWGTLYRGKIVLRNDSAVNVSKGMYQEFIQPYDERILEEFGSGSIHFCGRADQIVVDMAYTKGNEAMNFGYMDNVQFGEEYLKLLKKPFMEKNIPIINYHLTKEEYKNYKNSFDTGITLKTSVDTYEEAVSILRK
ncbi:uroporphyrinogen decarboxylase/cobalamine-independent methonine synthase family protein [Vallitalea guaymasensis]|uniref:Uroporphyrinogen decarboxylase (URO-D) domain-containing protein n=1 Tax=Vallitalea guaymasensis TaxID=1185412 RepID=A0A8J8SDL1_9FIRM|nr:uroporphyrinogen decarboxylase family protein [Vallitalea guaymasensis]QUH30610.1 hypothetical protein HYG85_17500 [Vallitalea guaymasensis]